jgi:PAS domain S-box-containing protein
VFSSTGALFALSAVNTIYPPAAPLLGPVLVSLLVTQPALMLWLASQVVRLPSWTVPLAFAGCAAVVIAFYALNRSVPVLLLLVGYFGLTELLAASLFVREGRRRLGLPRIRLGLAGLGSLLFGASIVIAGASSAARGGEGADPNLVVLTRSIALLAGIGYLAAFAPPRWVLQLAHRALAFDLIRSVVASPSGTDPKRLWHALAATVGQILGTPRVRVDLDGEQIVPEPAGSGAGATATRSGSGASGQEPGDQVEVPLNLDGRRVAILSATLDNRALFLEDDISLIRTLGTLTARAVEREQAIADLAAASRTVAEADAVRASEGRFRALLEAEPNAMLAVDDAGKIRWATRSAAAMFAAGDGELVGRSLNTMISREIPATRTGAAGSEPVRFDTSGIRSDGESFPAEVAVTRFEFEHEPYRLVVISDVTWRHEANDIRERFIGVLSHELRTPITAIYGGTQVLLARAGKLDPATQSELLTDIAGEAERLQRMIENLLVLARVEGGSEVADPGPVLLHRVLPEVVAREGSLWPAMRITTDLPASLPLVVGDEASLSLVLRNLISNVGKYAGPDAAVQVTVSVEPGGEVCVRVLDDGPGVEADESDRIFELYFRSKATHAVPGSGIGLFVCRQLVAAMGGRMWARSRPEGGAEFGFALPVYSDVEEEAVPAPAVRQRRRMLAATAEA